MLLKVKFGKTKDKSNTTVLKSFTCFMSRLPICTNNVPQREEDIFLMAQYGHLAFCRNRHFLPSLSMLDYVLDGQAGILLPGIPCRGFLDYSTPCSLTRDLPSSTFYLPMSQLYQRLLAYFVFLDYSSVYTVPFSSSY